MIMPSTQLANVTCTVKPLFIGTRVLSFVSCRESTKLTCIITKHACELCTLSVSDVIFSLVWRENVSVIQNLEVSASVDRCIGFCLLCGGVCYRESLLDGGSTVLLFRLLKLNCRCTY